ncbi:MAG: DNA repair protein RecO [Candidatus Gottesmanbacteria bacterium]|nr:DNA repair protein RecO [Candidatus Gottesmanbacteria bacterium]
MTTLGREYRTNAIILKRRNIGEADRVVTIFSKEYGKMKVIAKGIRRIGSRRSPHVEVFSHSILMLHRGKTWDLVTEATPLDAFSFLRIHLPRVTSAYYLCELVDVLLPDRQEHRDVYTLLLSALQTLNGTTEIDPVVANEQYALELLRLLGYLAHDRSLPASRIDPYIEQIIEKRLRTPKFLMQLA